jgi:hypothetical protein
METIYKKVVLIRDFQNKQIKQRKLLLRSQNSHVPLPSAFGGQLPGFFVGKLGTLLLWC